jgi:hypothetical protein
MRRVEPGGNTSLVETLPATAPLVWNEAQKSSCPQLERTSSRASARKVAGSTPVIPAVADRTAPRDVTLSPSPVRPPPIHNSSIEVIPLAAAIAKPARVDSSKNGTESCDWCCDDNHVDAGNVLTHNACNNTGHMSGCQYRIKHLRR